MPRSRKTAQDPKPDEAVSREDEGGSRPSQLDDIRAAMAKPPSSARKGTPVLSGADSEAEPVLPPSAAESTPELPAPTPEEAAESEPVVVADPPEPEAAAPEGAAPEPEAAPPAATAAAEPVSAWVPPPAHPPAVGQTAMASRPGSSGLALGIVLVVVGFFFLVMRLFDIDLSSYGWPLYVIIPGLTLLIVGFISLGTGALIPGGIITMAGLVLAYQNSTGDWASWAYAWALAIPGGVGLGIFLQGLRVHDSRQIRQGRTLMFWSLLIFIIGFTLFESVLDISGIDYGIIGRAALPALLIIIGVTLLARSWQRSRRT